MKPKEPQTRLRLPRLTNSQYDCAADIARKSGIPLDECPTCRARELHDDDSEHYGWINGTYKLDGVEHECDCQTQMMLRKHYLLANIGDQYQRLNWAEFQGGEDVKETVDLYLDNFDHASLLGMGIEFSSPQLGVGKTFAATHIAKELVKKGVGVYFIPFLGVIGLLSKPQDYRNAQEDRLRDINVLILDEVVPAVTAPQRQLFAGKFEELVRHRTNFNRPIVMTTNLAPKELHGEYPRTYSLLEAKQIRVEMNGEDARQGVRGLRNIELLANGEIEPIT